MSEQFYRKTFLILIVGGTEALSTAVAAWDAGDETAVCAYLETAVQLALQYSYL